MTESAGAKARAGSAIGAQLRRIPAERRRGAILIAVSIALLAFPLIDRNGGDIDAAANACAFATLALGLNIVVGYAGLLDLGYAAFFAIGAYTYGALSSWQIQPLWSDFWEPFGVARPGRPHPR
jgi:branched-chain amino acid transport system permease protein